VLRVHDVRAASDAAKIVHAIMKGTRG